MNPRTRRREKKKPGSRNHEDGKARSPTTSRTLVHCVVLCLAACSDQAGEVINSAQDFGDLESLLQEEALFKNGYHEDNETLYIIVQVEQEGLTTTSMRAASVLQTGKALLGYANTRCPATVSEIELGLSGLSRRLTRFEEGLYVELWSVPKKQLDEKFRLLCEP